VVEVGPGDANGDVPRLFVADDMRLRQMLHKAVRQSS
jgi:hypothetical protein